MSSLTYTEYQALNYLERINYPLSTSLSLPPPTLETLRRLVACHLSAVPWGTVGYHYSIQRGISLDNDRSFDKLINQRKCGWCVEMNSIFAILLRTLGYSDLYTVGARVWANDRMGFTPLCHIAIILILNGVHYLVDVGFGTKGLTAPLPIFDGELIDTPMNGVIPEQHRIHMTVHPKAVLKTHKIWTLQHRENPDAKWTEVYGFEKDVESFEGDHKM